MNKNIDNDHASKDIKIAKEHILTKAAKVVQYQYFERECYEAIGELEKAFEELHRLEAEKGERPTWQEE